MVRGFVEDMFELAGLAGFLTLIALLARGVGGM